MIIEPKNLSELAEKSKQENKKYFSNLKRRTPKNLDNVVHKLHREEFEKTELLKYSKDYYRKKGSGRPTKKDRRDIDDYYEDN